MIYNIIKTEKLLNDVSYNIHMYQKRNNKLEIIKLYTANYKNSFYLREISQLSKIPLKTTQDALKILEKENIIKGIIRGKNKYFTLNINNSQTKFLIIQAELYKTAQFLEKYQQLNSFAKSLDINNPIIIFGSFAKSTADKNSDIDILIISDKEQKLSSHLMPQKMHEIIMNEKTFKESIEKQEALIKEIENAHIILNNHSFYVNSMWNYYGK